MRSTAAEMAAMGFDPSKSGHGGWFDFVRDMGDQVDGAALAAVGDLLRQIERDRTLRAEAIQAPHSLTSSRPAAPEGLAYWAFNPLLRAQEGRLKLTRQDPNGAGIAMIQELANWRALTMPRSEGDDPPAPFEPGGPELWREYLREDIAPLFGARFSPGNWNSGIVRLDNTLILLTTLKKGSLTTGNHYEDHFIDPLHMQWQSQTQTRRDSQIGRMIEGTELGARVHLFVRNGKLRNGKAAPFLYCGRPRFETWTGEKPITVTWELQEPVPPHLRASLGIR